MTLLPKDTLLDWLSRWWERAVLHDSRAVVLSWFWDDHILEGAAPGVSAAAAQALPRRLHPQCKMLLTDVED